MDQTRAIARSKAICKARGPFMVTCCACGKRYWPEEKEHHFAHLCRPIRAAHHSGGGTKPGHAKKRPTFIKKGQIQIEVAGISRSQLRKRNKKAHQKFLKTGHV
jgi:hypothetical protein